MKLVYRLLSLLCIGLCACSSEIDIDPIAEAINPSGEFDEWSLEMQLPDDLKTRAAGTATPGADGLYAFSDRDINKLWYAVYYDDRYVYDCTTNGAAKVERVGDKFTMDFKTSKNWDPTKVKLFFWAGNADDNVTLSDATSASNGINLNFVQRCVSVDSKYLNGNGAIAEYDSFCGYFPLSQTANITNYNLRFSLKRPFAQIHILSDSFTRDNYSNGIQVIPGFGRNAASASNMGSEMVVPTTWFFDGSSSMNPSYRQNEYIYSQSTYEFSNNLANQWPSKTNFNGRDFYYLGCLLTFAPNSENIPSLQGSQASGNTAVYSKLNISIRRPGQEMSAASFASVTIPSTTGIKANNRYVVYNKYVPPAPSPYIEVLSVEPSSVGYTGGTVVIKIKSLESPSYTLNDSWVTKQSEDRSGDITTITLNIAANAGSSRTSTIVFKNGDLTANASIDQQAAPAPDPYLSVISIEPQSVAADGGQVVIKVKSNVAPSYNISSSWYSKASDIRSGDVSTITLSVISNGSQNERSATITFTNGNLSANASFGQQGIVVKEEYLSVLSVNPTTVSKDGGDVMVKVKSSAEPSYSARCDWLTYKSRTVSGDEYTYTFTASANSSTSRSFAVTFTNADLTANATINQEDGTPPAYLEVQSVSPTTVDYSGGDVTIVVKSSETPTYTLPDTWLKKKSETINGDITTLVLTVDANTSEARSSTITFVNGTLTANATVSQEDGTPTSEIYNFIIIADPTINGTDEMTF